MDFGPNNELLFSDDVDYEFLEQLRFLLSKPEVVHALADTQSLTENGSGNGELSRQGLIDTLAAQATAHLQSLGIEIEDSTKLPPKLSQLLRITDGQERGVVYELPPKWAPAVILIAASLYSDSLINQDQLLKLVMGDQPLNERLRALTEGAIDSDGDIDPDFAFELGVDYTQRRYDVAVRAGEILTQFQRILSSS